MRDLPAHQTRRAPRGDRHLGEISRLKDPRISRFVPFWLEILREFEAMTYPELIDLLLKNKIFIKRTANIGVCPVEVAISYDLTGPNLRGSGPPRRCVPRSLRRRTRPVRSLRR